MVLSNLLEVLNNYLGSKRKGDLANKPFPPNYRKLGLFTVSYPKKWLKLIDNKIKVPLGKKVKAWFGLDAF